MNDRDLILARRARFIGSALLALAGSCGPGSNRRAAEPTPVNVPPPSASEGKTESSAARSHATKPAEDVPPVDVPDDAQGIARRMYESLSRQVEGIGNGFSSVEHELPAVCDLSDPKCEQSWRGIADRLRNLATHIGGLRPVCPGSSEQAKRYDERVELHVLYWGRRLSELSRDIDQRFPDARSRARWQELVRGDGLAEPRVCLDCANW